MRFRNTLIVALLCLALGAYVYFIEIKRAGEIEEMEEAQKRAFAVDWNDVERLTLRNANGTFVLERIAAAGEEGESEEGEAGTDEGEDAWRDHDWRLVEPLETGAEATTVRSMITTLKGLKEDRLIEEDSIDPSRFGLAEARFAVTLGLADGTSAGLKVGNKSPVGSNSYMMRGGKTDVLLASSNLELALKKKLFDLREKKVVSFERDDLRGISVRSADGDLELARKDDSWWIEEPIQAKAKKTDINKMITSLANLTAKRFEDGHEHAPASFGLDEPRMRVALTLGEDGAVKTILIGVATSDRAGELYAKRTGKKEIYIVADKVFEDLNVKTEDLRDKSVLDFKRYQVKEIRINRPVETISLVKEEGAKWSLAAPAAARADGTKVNQLLSALTDLEAEGFVEDGKDGVETGLNDPRCTMELLKRDGEEEEVLARLMVGGETDDDGLFVRNALEETECVVDVGFLESIPGSAFDFRDRKALSFARYKVREVELFAGGETIVLERDDDGQWEMTSPSDGSVEREKVDALLNSLGKLEADEIIEADDKSLSLYGLVKPELEVVLYTENREEVLAHLQVGSEKQDSGLSYMIEKGSGWLYLVPVSLREELPSGAGWFSGPEGEGEDP
ncbi:DUF4340 domain-containing protein [Thermodesulfobacteriota bacterium]